MSRWSLRTLLLILLLSGVATVADALVVTDQERLESFVDSVAGDRADRRIDAALDHADLSRVAVEVQDGRRSERFRDGDEIELADEVQRALATLAEPGAELIQDSIEIEGDRAHVALRLRAEEELLNTQFTLVRRGDGWILSRVRVL